MLHSHEGLDRAGGVARGGLLAPLRLRDFRLLWSGACISLLGDGAFLVALAWAVYELSDVPTAMSLVGIAMTVPTIVFLLVGGVASDRLDRRRIMLAADVARAVAVGALAVLSLTGALELWHVVVLVVVYGTGAAFFAPAFDAIVPELVPAAHLAQANALEQIVRPLAMRLAGPALGGLLVGTFGAGTAFALDAASFLVSAAALLAMRRGAPQAGPRGRLRARRPARGLALRAPPHVAVGDVRQRRGRLPAASWGPVEVLLPLIVKQELGGSATDLGLVFAAGGLGSVGCAVLIGRRGLPRRDITFMYAAWTLATLAVAGYGVAGAVWQLMLASARLQRAGDRRDDRVGDGEAAPRARATCSAACPAWTG